MSVADPDRLWWLLLVPLLVWWSAPPPPRRIEWTPHLAAVERALAALRRRPPQRSWLRLLLLLAATVAGVLAHAGLQSAPVVGPERLVVLLDGSASMAARDIDGATRWEAALARIRSELAKVPPHVEVSLLRCGGPALRRYGAMARAATDLGVPSEDAVALSEVAERIAVDATVWTVTDGQSGGLPDGGALHLLGAAADNVAIAAARLEDHWPLPELAVEVDLVGFFAAPVDYSLSIDGEAVVPTELRGTLAPGQRRTERVALARQREGGTLRVRVAASGDALPDDDARSWTLPPLPAPAIAALADRDAGPFAAVAAAALAEELGGRVVGPEQRAASMLLVDGGEVEFVPGSGRALCFGARLAGTPKGDVWLLPRVVDWDRRSPLLAGLDLSGLRVEFALPETLPPGQPILFGAGPDGRPR
ncbi:MAG: hypothetical protein RL398_2551, partial [Planctomycetota bacterium]